MSSHDPREPRTEPLTPDALVERLRRISALLEQALLWLTYLTEPKSIDEVAAWADKARGELTYFRPPKPPAPPKDREWDGS